MSMTTYTETPALVFSHAGTLDPFAHLNQLVDAQAPHRPDLWLTNADALAAYRLEEGRWPLTDAFDEHEARLAAWQQDQRDAAGAGAPHFTNLNNDYLNLAAPGWTVADDDAWYDTADDLAEFRDANGRWPNLHSEDGGEARLARWRNKHRAANTDNRAWLTAAYRTYLNLTNPGWQNAIDTHWSVNVKALEAFLSANHRWPSAKHCTSDEGLLATWLASQRGGANHGAAWFTAEKRSTLNRVAPGWDRFGGLNTLNTRRRGGQS